MTPAAVTPPKSTDPLPDYTGYVDKIGSGTVVGWAAYRPDLSRRVIVRLYLDECLSAEGVADKSRDDVRDAGFGDGLHGFQFMVPKRALFCAEMLVLAILDEDGTETIVHRYRLRQPISGGTPALYMDASDLIEFLTHHRELSGIQRVQAGYLLGLGNATISGTECRICTRFKFSSFYFDIPYDRFAALLEAAGDLARTPKSAWAGHVRAFKDSLVERTELKPGDTIFTMGAPWALDDHNETIRCAKLFYGAHYLQIFYDLIPISVPEVVPAPLIPRFARAMSAMTIYADHVFSISRYSQDDLADTLRRLGRPVPEITVVPMGGSITDAETHEAAASALDALGVKAPFVLCVGTLEPRKNHMLLFQVWRRLVARHGAENVPRLVLVGRVGWYMEDFIRTLKVTGYVEKTVLHLQGVSNAELAALYDACLFTAFPSFSEGWGLPITESLVRGKVCVCSSSTSMPEAGGDHALYIDPHDTSAAYDLFEKLIFDGETLARGETQVASFQAPTWAEASNGLRAQFADLVPRLASLEKTPRKPIEFGRTYKFYNIEAASPEATSNEVFRDFLDQEDVLDLLVGRNWFDLDVNCTWACGPDAILSLLLPEGDLEAYVGLVIPPACDDHKCVVTVDGRERAAFRVKAGTLILAVPMAGVAKEHRLAVRLEGERVPSPDARMIGPGVSSLVVFSRTQCDGAIKTIQGASVQLLSEVSLQTLL